MSKVGDPVFLGLCLFNAGLGLQRVRDNLMEQLRDLQKSKPRGKADENLIADITRLESAHTVAKDDLVSASST